MPIDDTRPPPAVTMTPVPDGFVPVDPSDFQGYRPLASHLAALPDAVAEIQAFADYEAVFGITAPDRAELLRRVTAAAHWTALLAQVSAWLQYVQSQEAVAWKDALLLVQAFKAPFELASRADPGLPSRTPRPRSAARRAAGPRPACRRHARPTPCRRCARPGPSTGRG